MNGGNEYMLPTLLSIHSCLKNSGTKAWLLLLLFRVNNKEELSSNLVPACVLDLGKVLLLPSFGELPQWAVVGEYCV